MQEGTEEGNDNSDPPPPPPFSHSMKFTRKKGEEEGGRKFALSLTKLTLLLLLHADCRMPACLQPTKEPTPG